MAATDYLKKKELSPTTVNDSGATINKAQPILLVGGDDSSTGTGDIVLDWANISSESDIAVYDQNGNLLPYEIESFDATSETATLWAYGSWVRDDTVQAQVVYGNGPASSEEGTASEVWGNTGQNYRQVYHLNETSGTTIDSTANNNDSVNTTGTNYNVTGEYDGARGFDGTDDLIDLADSGTWGSQGITSLWVKSESFNDLSRFWYYSDSSTMQVRIGYQNGALRADGSYNSGGAFTTQFDFNSTNLSTGEWHHIVLVWQTDNSQLFVDGTQVNSDVSGTVVDTNHPDDALGVNNFNDSPSQYHNGELDEVKTQDTVPPNIDVWQQAEYDASPKAGQVFFSQSAAQTTLAFNGVTTTANASASGDTISLSGGTTANTTTANATGSGATIFIEPDFATMRATANGSGETISISGQTTVMIAQTAQANGSGNDTLDLKPNLLLGQGATASGSGETISTDRLKGFVDVEDQPTAGVDVNVVDKTNKILYETTTDSNGDWIVDSGNGIVYQVAYLFDDGTTYYGDAEQSDTT